MLLMLSGITLTGLFIAFGASLLTRVHWVTMQGLRPVHRRGHIVVCGAGSIGSGVIDLLLALDKRLVVVELNPDSTIVERAREQHFDLLTGDASRDTTLDLCNLGAAHSLIALTNVDTLNLEIALGARARNPTMPIVLRIAEASFAESIARHFEFETTFSAAALAAPAFVGLARFPGIARTRRVWRSGVCDRRDWLGRPPADRPAGRNPDRRVARQTNSKLPTISTRSVRMAALWSSSRSHRSEKERTRSPPRRSGSCSAVRLDRQFAPDRRVVGGAVLGPRLLVDVAGGDPVGRMRRQQQMVDPQPLVAVPAPGLVIPEGVAVRLAVEDAVGVGQPEIEEGAEPRARFEPAQRIVAQRHRIVNIVVGRADVVVAGQHERDLAAQQFARVVDQPLHPGELVGEFVGADGIAVRQIDRGDAHLAERRFDVARLLVLVIAGQAGRRARSAGAFDSSATPL